MSVFPKRIGAGDTVMLHWHVTGPSEGREPACPVAGIRILGPNEREWCIWDGPVLALPDALQPPSLGVSAPPHVLSRSPGLDQMTSPVGQEWEAFLRQSRRGTHRYFSLSLPTDAVPGSYRIESFLRINGEILASNTSREDSFHLDSLAVETAPPSDIFSVMIRNLAPHSTPCDLLYRVPGGEWLHEPLQIGGNGAVTVALPDRRGWVFFAEGKHRLGLPDSKQPWCYRNPEYTSISSPDDPDSLIVARSGETQGHVLTGPWRTIFLAANGLNNRDDLQQTGGEEPYAELLSAGLIVESTRC